MQEDMTTHVGSIKGINASTGKTSENIKNQKEPCLGIV
jgi:hypothetical protein